MMNHSLTRAGFPFLLAPILLAVLLGLASVQPADAQPGGVPTSTGGASSGNAAGSFYDYSKSGDVPMDISIWGFVRAPGRYRVPSYTKLMELISLAGGPADRAKLDEVKIVHDMTIDSTIPQPTTNFNLEEYQVTGDPRLNPVLTHNDVIIIPGDSISDLTEILGIISNVIVVTVSVLGLIFTVTNSNK